MKCPLITAGFFADPNTGGQKALDCLKEECAWWDAASEWCILKTVAHEVHALRVELQEIKNKMPHADQFTK